jgi:uncharacterized membrane protein
MSTAVAIHLTGALLALAIGIVVLARRKGTASHKALGRSWVVLMLVVAISSLWIPSFLHFSWIHIFTAITLVSVPMGYFAIRSGKVSRHRHFMIGGLIGLIGAGAVALRPGRIVGNFVWTAIGLR